MPAKLKFFYKVITLLGDRVRQLPLIVFCFLMASFIDLLSVGLIGPYVAMMLDADTKAQITSYVNVFFNIQLNEADILKWFSLFVLLIFFIKMLAGIFIQYLIIRFSEKQSMYLKFELMKIYQSMPYDKAVNRNSADYIYRIHQLTNNYTNGVLTPFLKMTSDILVAVMLFTFLAYQDIFILISLLILLIIVIGGYDAIFKTRLKIYSVEVNQAGRDTLRGISEAMEGLKEIRILGKESVFFNLVEQGARQYSNIFIKNRTIASAPRYLIEFSLVFFAIIVTSIYLFSNGNINELIPLMAMFMAAALRLLPSAVTISSGLSSIRARKNAVDLLFEDYQYKNKEDDNQAANQGDKQIGDFAILQLENVDFTYTGNTHKALNDISLTIRAGDAIGLIGHSGAGKTSLVDLILGLLVPVQGGVHVNDIALPECLKDWHRKIAYIPQDVFLLDASFEMNVTFENKAENINREKLQYALEKASLGDVVQHLPDGLQTKIGEKGVRLSGGQKQRIALARAFYHDREFLIMDEATNALDEATEARIIAEIKRLKGDITMIVIAHRLSTVRHCNKIIELENGAIINQTSPHQTDAANP